MPPSLRIEIGRQNSDEWILAGIIRPGDPDGSISDNHKDGRDIYLFGVDPINNQGYVKRSEFGLDEATSEVRIIDSIGFTAVASLDPGESYELAVRTDVSSRQRRVRFRYLDD